MTQQHQDNLSNYLCTKANELLAEDFVPFNPKPSGHFPFYWQDAETELFSSATYGWVSRGPKSGTDPLELGNVLFADLYAGALSKVKYYISDSDQHTIDDLDGKRRTLLARWKAMFPGATTADKILQVVAQNWAKPPTTVDKVLSSSNIPQLLNNAPPDASPVVYALGDYIAALNKSKRIEAARDASVANLQGATEATQRPNELNGGAHLDDRSYKPAYVVQESVDSIIDSLASSESSFSVTIQVAYAVNGKARISVDNGPWTLVSLETFFALTVGADPGFFGELLEASPRLALTLSFSGVTTVRFSPALFDTQTKRKWFYKDAITSSVANDIAVSGFFFESSPNIDFSRSGPFAHVSSAGISSFPTISITATGLDNPQEFASTVSAERRVGVSLLGTSPSQDTVTYYAPTASATAGKQQLEIKLSPRSSPIRSAKQTAFVLGVKIAFPGLV
jgi:hypothetical protein